MGMPRRGYTYEEVQIHMRAYKEGKTTEKKVIVVEKQDNERRRGYRLQELLLR